jgi:hypothetical protein
VSAPGGKLSSVDLRIELSKDDRERLSQALGSGADVDRIADVVARAGAREALAMATGRAVFSSIADLRAFRISCLLAEGLGLSEAEHVVQAIFQVPSGTARGMVNKAVARYGIELSASVGESIRGLLDTAAWREGRWEMRMPSAFVRERVWDVVNRLDVPNPVTAERGTVWKLADETYQALRTRYGVAARKAPKG